MRDPLSRDFSSLQASPDSWLHRVRENFQQLLTPSRIFPSSANGAPIHFLKWEKSPRAGRAQSASLLTHAAIIAALAVLAIHAPGSKHGAVPPGQKTGNYLRCQRIFSTVFEAFTHQMGAAVAAGTMLFRLLKETCLRVLRFSF
jgi:hypothetical protein